MLHYRILVVDNDTELLRRAARLGDDPAFGLTVKTARDAAEAMQLIKTEFFHAAFIDLQLDPQPARFPEGLTVLNELRELRPACRRFLLTSYVTENRSEVFRLLDPRTQLVDSVVDKANLSVTLPRVVNALAHSWLTNQVRVTNLDEVAAAVKAKCAPARNSGIVGISADEVDFVLSSLLGQGRRVPDELTTPSHTDQGDDRDVISSIDLQFQTKGRSRSVVAAGRPVSVSGHPGVYCVFKLCARDDALEEQDRYERYLRFGVSSDRRVELLGAAMGDAIGGLCYGFAGRAPGRVTDLEALFEQESDRAPEVLRALFGREASDWSGTESREPGRELTDFFADAYGLEFLPVVDDVRKFVESHAASWNCVLRGDALHFGKDGSERLLLPTARDSSLPAMRDEYVSAVVHGDLNAANVMVADDDRFMLIDFRHTARGPRLLDAAALQVSIRLNMIRATTTVQQVLETVRIEASLLGDLARLETSGTTSPRSLPYWANSSWYLASLIFAKYPGVATDEYAATCLLYTARVLRVTQIDELARLRLLVWASVLLERLRKRSK